VEKQTFSTIIRADGSNCVVKNSRVPAPQAVLSKTPLLKEHTVSKLQVFFNI